MSEKTARVLSQPSNRSNPRDSKEKKVVFKGVLDNPFRIQWPSVPINLQNTVLAYILQILEGVSEYHDNRSALSRKRKRAAKSSCDTLTRDKKQKLQEQGSGARQDDAISGLVEQSSKLSNDNGGLDVDDMAIRSPPILRHIVYGINAVTKRLELQSHSLRRPTTVFPIPSAETQTGRPFKYLFVCRQDVDPPILVDHLPHLVASCNSAQASNHVKLVPLPKGSELVLAQTLGIRRVTVLGIDIDLADDSLHTMLEPIPILTAPWLSNAKPLSSLIPTHIKHLRTSAPKDMKAAKEARSREKAEAKKAKKAKKLIDIQHPT